jgi:hypothetical protein
MGNAHHRLDLPTLNVDAFVRALEQKQLNKDDKSFLHFAEEDWSGWLINGCRQVNREGFVLGYTVDSLANRASYFPEACPFIDAVPGEKHAIRLFRLAPGVNIDLHVDTGEFYLRRHWREIRKVHVPLVTNESCRNYEEINGQKHYYWFKPGEFWMLNGNERHGALNYGLRYRWHLVIDVDPSPELESLMRPGGESVGPAQPSTREIKML